MLKFRQGQQHWQSLLRFLLNLFFGKGRYVSLVSIRKAYSVAIFIVTSCTFNYHIRKIIFGTVFGVQNFETKVLACQRAMTARIRISTIHMISALGIKEFSQYAL